MKSTLTHVTALALVAALGAAASCSRKGEPASSSAAMTIAVIPKGTTHEFWQSIHAGANKAGKELGVEVIWRGPLREDDRDAQVSEVEGFISRGVSGIVLAPLDESALVGPVADAMSRKIPVVIFDSGLKGDDYVSFVATDNVKGGRMAGERVAQSLGGKGKVVLLRYAEGHDSTGKREEGFLEAIAGAPGHRGRQLEPVRRRRRRRRVQESEALLSKSTRSPTGSLDVDGIFCANESTTFAMMRVLQENGWAGKVKFVGFDASANLVKGLRDGALDGLVVQDPVKMGYLGVKTMVAHLKGERSSGRSTPACTSSRTTTWTSPR